jgi:hypothetical protein
MALRPNRVCGDARVGSSTATSRLGEDDAMSRWSSLKDTVERRVNDPAAADYVLCGRRRCRVRPRHVTPHRTHREADRCITVTSG